MNIALKLSYKLYHICQFFFCAVFQMSFIYRIILSPCLQCIVHLLKYHYNINYLNYLKCEIIILFNFVRMIHKMLAMNIAIVDNTHILNQGEI